MNYVVQTDGDSLDKDENFITHMYLHIANSVKMMEWVSVSAVNNSNRFRWYTDIRCYSMIKIMVQMFELHHSKLYMYNVNLWSVLYFLYINKSSNICLCKFQCIYIFHVYTQIYIYIYKYIYGVCMVDCVALILLWLLPASWHGEQ